MLKSRVLSALYEHTGKLISGVELSKRLGVSRNAVSKAVTSLKNDGYSIIAHKNRGYEFLTDNDILSKEIISANLKEGIINAELITLKTVDSTNLYLKRLNPAGLREATVVAADEQTRGKGRMGRTFHSPLGEGVYMSLLLKPVTELRNVQFLTICAAVAVCRAIETVCGISAGVKWVNDIYYGTKKLCGILTEASLSAEINGVEYIITGIGINLGRVSDEVSDTAVSIYEITGKRGYKNMLIAEIINCFYEIYSSYAQKGKQSEILSEYADRLFILNKKVIVDDFSKKYEAVVHGLSDCGELIVKDEENNMIHLNSGEVSLKILEGD